MYRALILAALTFSGYASAQGVTSIIKPSTPAPSGCVTNYGSSFGLAAENLAHEVPAPVNQSHEHGFPGPKMPVPVNGSHEQIHTRRALGNAILKETPPQDGHGPAIPNHPVNPTYASTATVHAGPGAEMVETSSSSNNASCVHPASDALQLRLHNTILTDSHNRTGYIADNFQFQFDGPPQAGAISTAGYSVCSNGSLALGGSAVWWKCMSGGFYNLYDRYWAGQCVATALQVVNFCQEE